MDGATELIFGGYVKIHSPKGQIGEFVARGCQIWLTLLQAGYIFLGCMAHHHTLLCFVLGAFQRLLLLSYIRQEVNYAS